jgi:putative membrane protein
MLFSHIVLAVAVVPLALVTIHRGLRERLDQHRRIARWTWPIWMYVSATGVAVYLALYVVWAR